MAYVGDSTSKEERGGGMGVVGAAMGIGMVIGPGLGGWLAGKSLAAPFFLAGALSLAALVFIYFFLPEPQREKPEVQQTVRGVQIKQLILALSGPLGVLFIMAFLLSLGLANFESVFGLYTAERYQYTPSQVGLILMVVGLISAIIQSALVGPLIKRFGEINIIRASMASSAIGFILMTQATNFVGVLLSVSYFVISNAMLNPSVNSLISKRTESGQGITMGISNSFLSLGRIVGPLWAGCVFDVSVNLPYTSGAVIMLVGFGISLAALKKEELKQTAELETTQVT